MKTLSYRALKTLVRAHGDSIYLEYSGLGPVQCNRFSLLERLESIRSPVDQASSGFVFFMTGPSLVLSRPRRERRVG